MIMTISPDGGSSGVPWSSVHEIDIIPNSLVRIYVVSLGHLWDICNKIQSPRAVFMMITASGSIIPYGTVICSVGDPHD